MARNTANKQTPHTEPASMHARTHSTEPATSAHRNNPTHEQIARRAYEIFLARRGSPGNPEQDWFQAERELRLGRQ
ncbi:DUF2934 domain-containing protein [Pyxidicoccus parkwayensis]|uniref:DUF2934 domain-containing protein n=1 Tax=Pyxidicoccus parkwayensis TaxID=2813578 RepID=A0ABX7NL70_9BACT|nr:DUF2934 domain-containing protein [Pyxidicoccus parkwaysis]QSQ19368.1 DUF2934 domain-containing protein [Pyxidicoccus parkwaysis]